MRPAIPLNSPVRYDEGERGVVSHRGDPDKAFAEASITLDEVYRTPVETHNPIELHATVASWDGDSVTLYETSQAIVNHRNVLARMFGIPRRERSRHHPLFGFGIRRQIVAVAAVATRRGRRAKARSAGEDRRHARADVHERRPPPRNGAARASERRCGRAPYLAAARLRQSHQHAR